MTGYIYTVPENANDVDGECNGPTASQRRDTPRPAVAESKRLGPPRALSKRTISPVLDVRVGVRHAADGSVLVAAGSGESAAPTGLLCRLGRDAPTHHRSTGTAPSGEEQRGSGAGGLDHGL
mmetsp:Transcript_10520/g.11650  ORF Transcript_10520/g.11650 Transcript_10520/m.11650 type:complete len:122 (-) Transcript_10520:1293-1658(-)